MHLHILSGLIKSLHEQFWDDDSFITREPTSKDPQTNNCNPSANQKATMEAPIQLRTPPPQIIIIKEHKTLIFVANVKSIKTLLSFGNVKSVEKHDRRKRVQLHKAADLHLKWQFSVASVLCVCATIQPSMWKIGSTKPQSYRKFIICARISAVYCSKTRSARVESTHGCVSLAMKFVYDNKMVTSKQTRLCLAQRKDLFHFKFAAWSNA